MSDFRSFKNNRNSEKNSKGNLNEGDVKRMINDYSGKSDKELEDELIDRYYKEVAEGKMDGEKLQKIVSTVSGYLSDTQKEKLQNIIGKLK